MGLDDLPYAERARNRVRRALPTTALGLAGVLFLMSVAAAFSGAVLYAYYESRQEQTTNKVEAFFRDYNQSIENATKTIQGEGERAKSEIRTQLDELQKFAASGSTLTGLLDKAQPSVYFVSTLDQTGAPSVGSRSSCSPMRNSRSCSRRTPRCRRPRCSPLPRSRCASKDKNDIEAQLFTWDPGHDLALLAVNRANLPALNWIAADAATEDRRSRLRHLGLGQHRRLDHQGFIADVSVRRFAARHAIGTQFQGGPINQRRRRSGRRRIAHLLTLGLQPAVGLLRAARAPRVRRRREVPVRQPSARRLISVRRASAQPASTQHIAG